MNINGNASIHTNRPGLFPGLNKPAHPSEAHRTPTHRPTPAATMRPVMFNSNIKPVEKPVFVDHPKLAPLTAAAADVTTALDAVPQGNPEPQATAPAGSSLLQPQQLSLTEMAKHWGGSDSTYDLNTDGTVDVNDLLILINNWDRLTQPPTAQPTTAQPDKNLVAAVTNESESPAAVEPETDIEQAPPAVEPETTIEEPAPAEPAESPSQPEPVLVNAESFRTFLNSRSESGHRPIKGLHGAAARSVFASPDSPVRTNPNALGGLKSLSDSLFEHLSSTGFADQPPTNIRELVDALNLSPRQSDFMLKHLGEKYPGGLGVNMVA